jgi:hypothetical protein
MLELINGKTKTAFFRMASRTPGSLARPAVLLHTSVTEVRAEIAQP